MNLINNNNVEIGLPVSEELKTMLLRGFEKAEQKNFFGTVKTALKQRNFTVSLIGYTVSATANALWNASTIYIYKDI